MSGRSVTPQPEPPAPPSSPASPEPDGEFVGPWYSWWPGDPLPVLLPLPDFSSAPADDDRALAALARLSLAEVTRLRQAGNQPYLARLDGVAVAYGWSTGSTVEIGELGLTFTLPPGERYLWGFATEARWRGRGIYPHLLQAILYREGTGATRFWIGHTPANHASAQGILKAGFGRVGDVYRLPTGRFVLVPVGPLDRARVGAALLGADLRAASSDREASG